MTKRRKLPETRYGNTHRAVIGAQNVYISTGEYPDGTLGEVFLKVNKQGTSLRVYDTLATIISISLQYGVPLAAICDKLIGQNMQPNGVTSNTKIPIARSISDYLGKWLKAEYLTEE